MPYSNADIKNERIRRRARLAIRLNLIKSQMQSLENHPQPAGLVTPPRHHQVPLRGLHPRAISIPYFGQHRRHPAVANPASKVDHKAQKPLLVVRIQRKDDRDADKKARRHFAELATSMQGLPVTVVNMVQTRDQQRRIVSVFTTAKRNHQHRQQRRSSAASSRVSSKPASLQQIRVMLLNHPRIRSVLSTPRSHEPVGGVESNDGHDNRANQIPRAPRKRLDEISEDDSP